MISDTLDTVSLPMSSAEIAQAEMPAIFLGRSPERDRNIDIFHPATARAAIPAVK